MAESTSLRAVARARMLADGISTATVASLIGVDEPAIVQWFEGYQSLRPVVLARLSSMLHITEDELSGSDFCVPIASDEEAWAWEKELGAVGADGSFPLHVRLRALGNIPQTDVDPWLPERDGYIAILRDKRYDFAERIRIAEGLTAYGDPLIFIRRDLYREILVDEERDLSERVRTAGRMQDPDGSLISLRLGLYQSVVDQGYATKLSPDLQLVIAEALGDLPSVPWLARLARHKAAKISERAQRALRLLATETSAPADVRRVAFEACEALAGASPPLGNDHHVFVSYVRDDEAQVIRLASDLRALGVPVWLDTHRLRPGERWRGALSRAIRDGAAFIAVFSAASEARSRSYMREELLEAINELRLRPRNRAWFFPVLLSPVDLPDIEIGPGETLADIQYLSLVDDWDGPIARLALAVTSIIRPADR